MRQQKPKIVKPRTAKQKANDVIFKQREAILIKGALTKVKPPRESWWALGLAREQFTARAEEEYRARLKGKDCTANTHD